VRQVARGFALVVLALGFLTMLEHVGGWNFGVDQILAKEVPGALGVFSPNRMGRPASASFILAGMALLLLSDPRGRYAGPAQGLALGVCLIGLLGVLGYAYRCVDCMRRSDRQQSRGPLRCRCYFSA
jgi:hypothetical protein